MGNYVTEAEVRAEGATASSTRINARIEKWEAIVEKLTGNIFRVIEPGEMIFDGNNMSTLFFNLPLVSVSSLKINNETLETPTTDYRVFCGLIPPNDDRFNPRIELWPYCDISPIFRSSPGLFLRGYDQKVTAKWGYVDPGIEVGTYRTPSPIKDAIIQLVILDLDGFYDRGYGGYRNVASESTDGHSISYEPTKVGYWSMIPQRIADVLYLYRRPPIVTSPDATIISDPAMIYGW